MSSPGIGTGSPGTSETTHNRGVGRRVDHTVVHDEGCHVHTTHIWSEGGDIRRGAVDRSESGTRRHRREGPLVGEVAAVGVVAAGAIEGDEVTHGTCEFGACIGNWCGTIVDGDDDVVGGGCVSVAVFDPEAHHVVPGASGMNEVVGSTVLLFTMVQVSPAKTEPFGAVSNPQ